MRHVTPDGIARVLNWRPSRPNPHGIKLSIPLRAEADLPTSADNSESLADFVPFDQGDIGSCVDNETVSLYARALKALGYLWKFIPSRLFAYYNARAIEGTTSSDSGSTVADGIASLAQYGVCPEQELDGTTPAWIWPYDTSKLTVQPPQQCYKDALLHKVLKDHQVNLDRATVLNALAAGIPFIFGFTVNQSFMSQQVADTGVMPLPGDWLTDPVVGGHCVMAVGYALGKPMGNNGVVDWALCCNSWGQAWGTTAASGKRGFFWMPLDQVLCNSNIASDAHAIDVTSEARGSQE